jgi:Tfp pilus assembly protein PilZ
MVDKRKDQRFDTDVNVITSDQDGLVFGFVRNLSKTGAFIEMKRVLPIGMPFSFTLAHENVQTKIFGRVVRVDRDPTNGAAKGMAIQFANVQGHNRFVRDDLLLYAMTKKYLSMWDNDQDQAVNQ